MGQHMTQTSTSTAGLVARDQLLVFATAVFVAPAIFAIAASAQTLGYAPMQQNSFRPIT